MIRTALFSTLGQAETAMNQIISGYQSADTVIGANAALGAGGSRGVGSLQLGMIESIVLANRGTPGGSLGARMDYSTTMRETYMYQYQGVVYDQDMEYLSRRDPITRLINYKVPRTALFAPPTANVGSVDDFFRQLRRKNIWKEIWLAKAEARKHGFSFLYIDAGGDAGAPIEEGGSMWHGAQVITKKSIDWDQTVMDHGDPSAPFGIQKLAVKNSTGTRIFVDSSRLVPIANTQEDDIRLSMPTILPCYDSIWNRRDYEFMLRQSITEGNPYKIEVDTDAMGGALMGKSLTEEEAQMYQDEATEVRSGARDAFGPNEYIKISRVGSADLDDPEWGLRVTTGSIAAITEPTTNMMMPFSRGSEQITDQDRNDFGDELMIFREEEAWGILDRLVQLGRLSRFISKRRGVELPMDLEWPYIRQLPEREQAFVDSRQATTIRELSEVGRHPPGRIDRRFPKDPSAPITPRRADQGGFGALVQTPEDDDQEWTDFNDGARGPIKDDKRDE